VNVTIWYKEKNAQSYRQLYNIEKIDYCRMIKAAYAIPWFSDLVDWVKTFLPGLVKDCPITGVSN
jgi:hypothetical protein